MATSCASWGRVVHRDSIRVADSPVAGIPVVGIQVVGIQVVESPVAGIQVVDSPVAEIRAVADSPVVAMAVRQVVARFPTQAALQEPQVGGARPSRKEQPVAPGQTGGSILTRHPAVVAVGACPNRMVAAVGC
jgi:hypothetical protein